MKRILTLGLILLCFPYAYSDSQIEFVAEVVSVTAGDGDVVLLEMSLTPEFTITVRVTGETEIRDENEDPISVADLIVGMFLKVKGVFTSEGILALEIEVTDEEYEFEFKGKIESVDTTNQTISISGYVILVPKEAEIKDGEGHLLEFIDLVVGQLVKVKGNITEEGLVASEVKVKPSEKYIVRIRYEGVVTSIEELESGVIQVFIEGVGDTFVRITAETEIKGNLAVGLLVKIIGTIDSDLYVKAKKIIVKYLLHLAPHKLELHYNQTHRVEVILRSPYDTDVTLAIYSENPELAYPSTKELTIAAGKVTGYFEVTAGAGEGETVIEVQLPASLGGQTATLEVEVEGGGDRGEKEYRIGWRPDELRMPYNYTTSATLRLNQPAPTNLDVLLSLRKGLEGLVEYPPMVTFEKGSYSVKVEITSGSETGQVRIRATLPDDVGGDYDDLKVKVRGEKREEREKYQISWVPEKITAQTNETLTDVMLVLDHPAARAFKVELTVKEGSSDLVEFPAHVEFTEGSSEAPVKISTKERSGKVTIRAALPFDFGGDTDDLEIEIEAPSESSK
ncbi:DUF5666 domain-containing protein [Acidobacteria bacterium AH-259-A15]|nr:DUF5666 domain-containing protein [Acidobacteria bacterium AH-259-A15]